jgi:hypothetical protein
MMFRTAIIVILFLCTVSQIARADDGLGCNPPGSKVKVLYGPCAGKRPTSASNQTQPPLASSDDGYLSDRLQDAIYCDVGRTARASGGKSIDGLQITTVITNKATETDTDNGTLGVTLSPYPNVQVGGSVSPSAINATSGSLTLNPPLKTAEELVRQDCSKSARIAPARHGWPVFPEEFQSIGADDLVE